MLSIIWQRAGQPQRLPILFIDQIVPVCRTFARGSTTPLHAPTASCPPVPNVEDDGMGKFKHKLDIENTLDPSPYLGLPLNAYENRERVPVCEQVNE